MIYNILNLLFNTTMATRQISSDMGEYMSYIKFVAMSYATKHVLKM